LEPEVGKNRVSNPTLAARLKKQEPASQQGSGTSVYGGGQKKPMQAGPPASASIKAGGSRSARGNRVSIRNLSTYDAVRHTV